MSDVRWESEDQPDSALRTLAQVQPPEGMNERVLRRLRQAQETRQTARWRLNEGWLIPATVALFAVVVIAGVRDWNGPRPEGTHRGTQARASAPLGSRTAPEAAMLVAVSPSSMPARPSYRERTLLARKLRHSAPIPADAWRDAGEKLHGPQDSSLPQTDALEDRSEVANVPGEPLSGLDSASVPGRPLPALQGGGVPGRPLPRLEDGRVPGRSLPSFDIAATPGHPLPTFAEATNSGDQP